ncbi:DUF418 domain-containing protein [Paenibacillus glucanolyticus]|uniref:DUF418 domain-containing protein n=1 Tax=Paenibacillus glucanolyticus TaxID=59843 RepID=UPI00128B0AB0|nr:DUF418 domain-containing protein [Paenibacillus glucanolyticus]MPY19143.1 DUF418 domain-containing protein [Paenibacillus glucanolyticus]
MNSNKRSTAVDAIRGLSLLGILMANMLIFQYGMFGKDELHYFQPSTLDQISHDMLKVFVEGSFMPIFTFLFGYSMIKMRESLINKGLKYGRSFFRRSVLLIVLGLLHSIFIWEGDILLFYGAIGLFLVLFVKRKVKTIMIWGVLLLTLVSLFGYGSVEPVAGETERMESYVKQSIEVYGSGTYSEILNFRSTEEMPIDLPDWLMLLVILIAPLMSAPMFLFGMVAAKRGRFLHPSMEIKLYLRWALLVPVGLGLKTAAVMLGTTHSWSGVFTMLGGPLLALGYLYLFASLYAFSSQQSIVIRAFEAVGRMSLTNYLSQSVVCVLIFYGFGLGLFGKLGVLQGTLLAVLIYSVLAAGSLLWLKRFRSGPVERLLRMGTYWSWSGRAKPKEAAPVAALPAAELPGDGPPAT